MQSYWTSRIKTLVRVCDEQCIFTIAPVHGVCLQKSIGRKLRAVDGAEPVFALAWAVSVAQYVEQTVNVIFKHHPVLQAPILSLC